MPRNQTQGTTLRNRNRVTNKTRLKVVRGNIDADPLILDEEEERARVIATSGVDADDANEHHLQVAINAAAQRHTGFAQDSKAQDGASQKEKREPYIPTPDAAGIVKDYEHHYPTDRWLPPQTHLRSADTLEDTVQYGLSNGYSYYMDERDKEWLEKNNQAANGESTSAQAIVSGGLTSRSSRSSKLKGKDPDVCPAIFIKEDEFELIMGLFEKETDERYPFLHVDPAQIPPYSEYESLFAHALSVSYFSSFTVPVFACDPSRNAALGAVVYTHWRDRRKGRNGRRIMAQLTADESNENDPYVCFRRRDSKPIRKTRTAQNAITERMVRLKTELGQAYNLALSVLQREQTKQMQLQFGYSLWKARATMLDLKRKLDCHISKDDEDILVDKERPAKKPRTAENLKGAVSQKVYSKDSPVQPAEPRPSPKERYQRIQSEVADEMLKHRDKCSSWEDVADLSCQLPSLHGPHRAFMRIVGPSGPLRRSDNATLTSFRLRYGRGGRLAIDRRFGPSRVPSRFGSDDSQEDDEIRRRKEERWRYDADSDIHDPADETDRFILDDYQAKYLSASSILLTEDDRLALSTDVQSSQSILSNEGVKSQRGVQQRKHPGDPNHSALVQPSPPPALVPSSAIASPPGGEITRNGTTQMLRSSIGPTSSSVPSTVGRSLLPNHGGSPSRPPSNSNGEQATQGEQFTGSSTPAQPHTVLLPSSDHNAMFHAPSIARHKLQGTHPYLASQPSNIQLHTSGAQGVNNPGPHMNGDRLKHNLNGTQKTQGQTVSASYPNMSSPNPFYPLANISFNGQSNVENLNLAMGPHMNLKLPPNRNHSRAVVGSETAPPNGNLDPRSPIIRASSASGNQLSSPYRGSPSPRNGALANGSNNQNHTSPSPHLHPLANPGQQPFSPVTQGTTYHRP